VVDDDDVDRLARELENDVEGAVDDHDRLLLLRGRLQREPLRPMDRAVLLGRVGEYLWSIERGGGPPVPLVGSSGSGDQGPHDGEDRDLFAELDREADDAVGDHHRLLALRDRLRREPLREIHLAFLEWRVADAVADIRLASAADHQPRRGCALPRKDADRDEDAQVGRPHE
jgi:hypothetical protein